MLQCNGKPTTAEVRAPIASAESGIESLAKMQAPQPNGQIGQAANDQIGQAANNNRPFTKRTAKDYIFGKMIGEGCYSTVYLAKDIHTGKEYASK